MFKAWKLSAILAIVMLTWTISGGCFAVPEQPTPPPPALPTTVLAAGGPLRVERTWPVLVLGDSVWGSYESDKRLIRIDSLAPTWHQRRVLEHELVHAALDDAGLDELLSPAMQEAIAQAISAQRVASILMTSSPF